MKIITINRDYGAGGNTIGREVAKRLGIECYDKDIIKQTVAESGFDKTLVETEEEELTRSESIVRTINPQSYNEKDVLFDVQSKVILEFAKTGPCVIVGRCADVVLEEAGYDVIKVFITADEEHRMKRVSELLGTEDHGVIKRTMKKVDYARRAYYHYYTDHEWTDSRNYTMSLDSGVFGYDKCVELICAAYND